MFFFCQNISSWSMAMGKEFPPNLGLSITSTVRSGINIRHRYLYWYTSYYPTPVSHYAEGTLMPVIVHKMIFDHISKNTPFLIRPIIKMVFEQVKKLLVEPEITKNLSMVCGDNILFCKIFDFWFRRLKRISKNQNLLFSQADKNQLSVLNELTTHIV